MINNSVENLIDTQIDHLINNAPDRETSNAVKEIAPILRTIALDQKQVKYFLLQSPDGNLVLTTISQVSNPKISKNVIYAYPTEAIARQNQTDMPDAVIKEFEIIPLLFQLLGMSEVDSLILDEMSREIQRQKLYELCQAQLKRFSNIA
jgi:hypothetical protein